MSNFRISTSESWHTAELPHTTINTSKHNRNERPGKHCISCSHHRSPKSKERHTTINTSKPSSKHWRLPVRQNILTDNSPMGKLGKAGDVGYNISAPNNADAALRAPAHGLSEHSCKLLLLPLLTVQLGASALIILPRHVFPCRTSSATFLE
ncbi:hypothetical protein EAF00_005089 [Botryotinia globosa]|nr:hypothetical protein EAF00_005089 [Botryotinia globosa]